MTKHKCLFHPTGDARYTDFDNGDRWREYLQRCECGKTKWVEEK